MHLCKFIALSFFFSTISSSVVWNGNFNSYATTSDLDTWSWSNQVGEYQTYIYGNQNANYKMSSWATLDASYKNPQDQVASKGVAIKVNSSSIWNGGSMWRCELIPNVDKNSVQTGVKYYIWSMKQDTSFPLNGAYEHQLVFFEAHYADIKYGGGPGSVLYFYVNGNAVWTNPFTPGTWLTLALQVDYAGGKVALYTIDTSTNTATQVVAPTSVSTSNADWHVGNLRLPSNGNTQDPTQEILYYSSISTQTDLNNLPFGAASGSSASTSGSGATSAGSSTTGVAGSTSGATSSSASTSGSVTGNNATTGQDDDSSANTLWSVAVFTLVTFMMMFSL